MVACFRRKAFMFLALIASVSLRLAAAGAALPPAAPVSAAAANTMPNSSWQQTCPYSSDYDDEAERQLLDKTNTDRARLGLPPLKMDDGLVRAARAHAAAMAAQKHISHQFSGEPSLINRIAAVSDLHLERAGENVAVAANADEAHEALMASPPHRDNLLNPKFNVAGIGVFRQGHIIYVAQDFGMSIATPSPQEAVEMVAGAVEHLRTHSGLPQLQEVNDIGMQSNACVMAKADSLNAATPEPGTYLLRYTTMAPQTIPSEASEVIAKHAMRSFAVGTCYAQTRSYPNGAYWVVVEFY